MTLTATLVGGWQLAVGIEIRIPCSFLLLHPFLFILSRLPHLVDLYCSSIPLKDLHINTPLPPCLPFVALS